MSDDDRRAQGRAIRRELLGGEAIDRLDEELYTEDPVMDGFAELTQEFIFGTLWARPGIDLKTRCLVTLVSDVATGQIGALKLHLRFARRHGWSEEELVETMLHLMGYIGVPPVRQALIAAKETFAEMRVESEV